MYRIYEGELPPGPLDLPVASPAVPDAPPPVLDAPPPVVGDYQSTQNAQSLQILQPPSKKRSARSVISVPSVNSVSHDAITKTQRLAVFRLVRQFKRNDTDPVPPDEELREHRKNDAVLRSVPWDEFRLLFLEGWAAVSEPIGSGPLAEALAEADRQPLLAVVENYEDPQLRRLVMLCAVLQRQRGDAPFPLAGVAVALELDKSQPTISRWLRLLVHHGVLRIAKQGHTGKAREYWFMPGS